ncbi:MAG: Txe/YoeB family addiction module toxin [Holophagales bacterium]|jgi:toxin YoeB|nr:Txe/YoeB family addiction module toxin [Holophagales bacterium]
MDKNWQDDAWDDYLYWFQTNNKSAIKRIHTLLKDIERHPFEGTGKPEPLKENWAGYWSRRIDDDNRIIYRVAGNQLDIIRCRGHYK